MWQKFFNPREWKLFKKILSLFIVFQTDVNNVELDKFLSVLVINSVKNLIAVTQLSSNGCLGVFIRQLSHNIVKCADEMLILGQHYIFYVNIWVNLSENVISATDSMFF